MVPLNKSLKCWSIHFAYVEFVDFENETCWPTYVTIDGKTSFVHLKIKNNFIVTSKLSL